MSKRRFTKEEIDILSQNKHVSKCSEKSITYHPDFKVRAVTNYREGKGSREIFKEAGFDMALIGKNVPNTMLKSWNKILRTKGPEYLKKETRGKGGGRPKKQKDLSDKDKIKRLEAEVAYLKAENDFFIKLRSNGVRPHSSVDGKPYKEVGGIFYGNIKRVRLETKEIIEKLKLSQT